MTDQTDKNIYSILGLEHPEDMHFKANLVAQILQKMHSTSMTMREASITLKVEKSIICKVLSGQFHNIERKEVARWLDEISTK